MQLVLFHRYYKVSYLPKGFTSFVFYGFCLLCVLVAPFFIGLAMQNFWIKDNYLFHMPEVEFSNRCALRVTTVLGKEYMWTCSENFNEAYLYGDPMGLIPYLSVYQDERDEKGKISDIAFTLSIPINNLSDILQESNGKTAQTQTPEDRVLDAVSHVEFLPEFAYHINHYLIRLNMTAAPLLRFTRQQPTSVSTDNKISTNLDINPLCGLTEADLLFHSTVRLPYSASWRTIRTYESSPFVDHAKEPAALYSLAYFARHYALRNQSVEARIVTETCGGLDLVSNGLSTRGVWEDMQLLNAFTWRIRLRVQKAQLFYVPSFAESLKWAWVQYFAIAFVVQWVVWQVRGFFTVNGVLDTRAIFTRVIR